MRIIIDNIKMPIRHTTEDVMKPHEILCRLIAFRRTILGCTRRIP